MPSVIPNITVTRCQGHALLGAVALLGGGLLVVAGFIVIASNTRSAKNVVQVISSAAPAAVAA